MSQSNQRGRRVQQQKQGPSFRVFYIVLIVVGIAGAALLVTYAIGQQDQAAEVTTPITTQQGTGSDIAAETGRTAEGFYFKGPAEAPVEVVEYADFQCPACANFVSSPLYAQLQSYVEAGQVRYIFHDFPLSQHHNAPIASQAAYCAGDQGQYWDMHEAIFLRQSQWSNMSNQAAASAFAAMGAELGMDGEALAACINGNQQHQQHVQSAFQSAIAANIQATPTFVVNGRSVNAMELTPAIDAALAASSDAGGES
jgi:protein-disulfide isomerase